MVDERPPPGGLFYLLNLTIPTRPYMLLHSED